MPKTPANRVRPFLVNCLVGLAVCLLFFVFLELVARSYYALRYGYPKYLIHGDAVIRDWLMGRSATRFNSILDLTEGLKKTAETKFENRHELIADKSQIQEQPKKQISQEGKKTTWNNYGFRGQNIAIEKQSGTQRIVVTGGSFVWGHLLHDEQTLPAQMERQFDFEREDPVEVINAGKPAFEINDIVIQTISKLVYFNPDYLILFSAYNNQKLLRGEMDWPWMWHFHVFLRRVSLFYTYFQGKFQVSTVGGQSIHHDYSPIQDKFSFKIESTKLESLLSLYRRRLEQLYVLSQENQFRLIYGAQPEFFYPDELRKESLWNDNLFKEYLERVKEGREFSSSELRFFVQSYLNRTLRNFALEKGALYFDGVTGIENRKEYFLDSIHLNPRGAKKLAQALVKFISVTECAGNVSTSVSCRSTGE